MEKNRNPQTWSKIIFFVSLIAYIIIQLIFYCLYVRDYLLRNLLGIDLWRFRTVWCSYSGLKHFIVLKVRFSRAVYVTFLQNITLKEMIYQQVGCTILVMFPSLYKERCAIFNDQIMKSIFWRIFVWITFSFSATFQKVSIGLEYCKVAVWTKDTL